MTQAKRTGIAVAGNILVDRLFPISHYPQAGEICAVLGAEGRATGGAACNVALDLALLAPDLPLDVVGMVGEDENGRFVLSRLKEHQNLHLSGIKTRGSTGYTLVLEAEDTRQRTFFTYAGANALFDEEAIAWEEHSCRILHVGYALLLDRLDQPEKTFGTHMARLLSMAQALGIQTSLDTVSEAGARMAKLLPPALKYTDYFMINEFEAQQITGIPLTQGGKVASAEMKGALERLKELGVARWAVIHAPEGCFGLDEAGRYYVQPSLALPKEAIRGTVGAGDAFCAGVLLGAYQGSSLPKAMMLGVCAAASSLLAPGASEGLSTWEKALALGERYGFRTIKG